MKFVLFLVVLIAWSGVALSQPKKNKTREKLGTKLDSAKNVLDNIFQKRDNNKRKANSKTPNSSTTSTDKSVNALANSLAGTIDKNVVYIDADHLGSFKGGAAVIRKGNFSALINKKGEFLVSYESNWVISETGESHSGFFRVLDRSTQKEFLINASGKKIIDLTGNKLTAINPHPINKEFIFLIKKNEPSLVQKEKNSFIIIDTSGKISYTITAEPQSGLASYIIGSNSLIAVTAHQGPNKPPLVGYKNLQDKWVINPSFEEAHPFLDGMALVSKKDQFGKKQYGFIDITGKLIIPYKYSNQPSNFQYGLSLVRPEYNNSADRAYAFINKKGDIVFEATNKQIANRERNRGLGAHESYQTNAKVFFSHYGYNYDGYCVMDTLGNTLKEKDFASKLGLPERSRFGILSSLNATNDYVDPQMPVLFYQAANKAYQKEGMGFIWLNSKKIIPPIFVEYSGLKQFDASSRLCYAKMQVDTDPYKINAFREGYINEDGVFVILKKTKDEW